MTKRLLPLITAVVILALSLLSTGCKNTNSDIVNSAKKFIEKHYSINHEDVALWKDFSTGITPENQKTLDDFMYSFKDVLTEKEFNIYLADRTPQGRLENLYNNECTAEVKDLSIKEKEIADDMKPCDISFTWVIKDSNNNIKNEHKIMKTLYLSKENGTWLVNECNTFEVIGKDLKMNY